MSALVLQWRTSPRVLQMRWRGPQGALESIGARPVASIAGFIVPSASVSAVAVTEGDGIDIVGNEIRINIDRLPSA